MPAAGYDKRREAMRALRQEDERERIRESNLITDIIDNIGEMQKIADGMEGGEEGNLGESTSKINALQQTNNQRFKLLNKVLPDLKATEIEIGGKLGVVEINWTGVDDSTEYEEAE